MNADQTAAAPDAAFSDGIPDTLTLLDALMEAARAGQRVVREGAARRTSLVWETKSFADYLTEVDRDSEEAIMAVLTRRLPGAQFLGEESWTGAAIPHELACVVDPLDGTTNFLHGLPVYAVSIGALWNGVPIAGVVLDVERDELFAARLGAGATVNGAPLRVSVTTEPARALIGTGFPFGAGAEVDRYAQQFPPIARATSGIRRAGAAALDLAWVAAGRLDAFWELRLKPWDVAAGILLIAESGGVATGMDGARATVTTYPLVAGNPAMHGWLLDALQAADRGRSTP